MKLKGLIEAALQLKAKFILLFWFGDVLLKSKTINNPVVWGVNSLQPLSLCYE